MKIFLSWSGSRSREVALALRNWIPLILHYAEPWLSDKDIDAGERWSIEVGKELEVSNFGVICLTMENITAQWILFEAGALSKALQTSSVCPYLLDVEFQDITGPLSQFQAKKAERGQTLELLEAINAKSQTPIESARVRELFDALWPKLSERLSVIPTAESSTQAQRSSTNVLEDLVHAVRSFDSRLSIFEEVIGHELRRLPSVKLTSKPSGSTKIEITAELDTPKLKSGDSRTVKGPRVAALEMVARATGLRVNLLGTEWYLRDRETNEWLEIDELVDYFNKPESKVIVTDIPF